MVARPPAASNVMTPPLVPDDDRAAEVAAHRFVSHSTAFWRRENHAVGNTADGPSNFSAPPASIRLGAPSGTWNANLRTPAAPYRGVMQASRQSMTPAPN